eukprot:jgi/Orpsp1_1/1180768/evm.model.c7180000074583.1
MKINFYIFLIFEFFSISLVIGLITENNRPKIFELTDNKIAIFKIKIPENEFNEIKQKTLEYTKLSASTDENQSNLYDDDNEENPNEDNDEENGERQGEAEAEAEEEEEGEGEGEEEEESINADDINFDINDLLKAFDFKTKNANMVVEIN